MGRKQDKPGRKGLVLVRVLREAQVHVRVTEEVRHRLCQLMPHIIIIIIIGGFCWHKPRKIDLLPPLSFDQASGGA